MNVRTISAHVHCRCMAEDTGYDQIESCCATGQNIFLMIFSFNSDCFGFEMLAAQLHISENQGQLF